MTIFKGLYNNNSLRIVLIAVAYIALALGTLAFAFPTTRSIAVWFPSGLALAMVILFGVRIWPAITMGSLISWMLLFLHYELPFTSETVFTISLIAFVQTMEAVFGIFLLKKLVKDRSIFKHTSNIFLFILISVLISYLGGAIVALGLLVSNFIAQANYAIYLFYYGTSSLVALFVLTPFIVSWSSPFQVNFSKKILIESLLFIGALVIVLSSLLIDYIAPTIEKALPFIIIPYVFWLAFRANRQLLTFCITGLSILALYLTINELGPFVFESENDSMLMLQIFVSIISITAMIINATVHERAKAEAELKKFNERLEQNVIERTKELKEEINIRRATEEKMKVSNNKLRKANTELDNFVYSVSHDLRAPIASVLGLVNLAKKEKSVKAMRNYLEMVAKSAEQQDAFIRDILDLSRNARLDVMQDKIKFQDVIDDIFAQMQYIDNEKPLVKNISIDQKLPYRSDKSRVKVIFNNLISNAIRHNNGNEINIDLAIKVTETSASVVIKDNGQGIDEKHLDHIYKMFYRGTDTTAGSGLGLYIVKETVEKLRGAISINSEKGKGTTVIMELPNLYDKKLEVSTSKELN